jgi:hypothetical protein
MLELQPLSFHTLLFFFDRFHVMLVSSNWAAQHSSQ